MNKQIYGYGIAAMALACALAACGGGGGGGGPIPTGGSTSTPTTNPTNTPAGNATFTQTLVDHESGAPIAGMYVGLAPNTVGATPAPQPTTNASGQFTVTATPGTYLLVIGDGKNNRPVIHDLVTLTAGANTVTAPTIGPAPGATPNPIQDSGNFRLTTLTSMEQSCLAYENSVRASHSLSAVTSDEWLTEDNRGYWMVATATNSAPAYPGILTNYNSSTGLSPDCTNMVNNDFALNSWVSYSQLVWFSGDAGGANNAATAEGYADPRAPQPPPTPPHPWP